MGRRRPGIRGRLDAMQGDVHGTLAAVREAALGFLEELEDGFRVTLTIIKGSGSLFVAIWEFVRSEEPGAFPLQFELKIEPREGGE